MSWVQLSAEITFAKVVEYHTFVMLGGKFSAATINVTT